MLSEIQKIGFWF